jgi:hypothetical protein
MFMTKILEEFLHFSLCFLSLRVLTFLLRLEDSQVFDIDLAFYASFFLFVLIDDKAIEAPPDGFFFLAQRVIDKTKLLTRGKGFHLLSRSLRFSFVLSAYSFEMILSRRVNEHFIYSRNFVKKNIN